MLPTLDGTTTAVVVVYFIPHPFSWCAISVCHCLQTAWGCAQITPPPGSTWKHQEQFDHPTNWALTFHPLDSPSRTLFHLVAWHDISST